MNHLQRYLVEEFVEDYQEGQISRRKALKLIAGITGGAAAAQILAACGQPAAPAAPTAAPAIPTAAVADPTAAPATAAPTAAAASGDYRVAPDDPAVVAEAVRFAGDDSELVGYMARPAAEGSYPIVLVCHENRGLTPHIEDVTRRVAKAGYLGLAVDLVSRAGGTSAVSDTDSIPGLLSGAPPERHVADFRSGLTFAAQQPFALADRVAMVGFCFGGGVTWLVAAGIPELRAAVPFYGPAAPIEQVPQINAAVLAIYAERDNRINQSIPAIEAAMAENGKTYRKIIYPGVDHAFHNDTGQRYAPEQARAAWDETLAWFNQYLI